MFSLLVLNLYCSSQSKLIFSRSSGTLNSGETPDIFSYDLQTEETKLIYNGVVKRRGEYSASVSPDLSKIIVNTYQFGGWKLGMANYKNGNIGPLKKLTSNSNYEYNACWSHRGESIAYQDYNWSNNNMEVFIVDKNGENEIQLTMAEGGDRNPCWTKDDESIIYTSGRTNNYDIYIQSLDVENASNITNHPSNDFAPSTSSKHEKIAFLSDRNGFINLYTMDYKGNDIKKLTGQIKSDKIKFEGFENSGYWAYRTSWSKDGNYIVFNLMIDSHLQLFIVKKDGTGLQQITEGKYSNITPSWVE